MQAAGDKAAMSLTTASAIAGFIVIWRCYRTGFPPRLWRGSTLIAIGVAPLT
jgi:hypothetical protein